MDIKTGLHCEAVEMDLSKPISKGYMSVIIVYGQSALAWSSSNNDLWGFFHIIQKKKKITQLNTKCSLHYL